ncbi:MAG TPA: phosphoribosylamine--glycine ligase [Bacillota bacterium]|nr:phosphoribosylamine--glycine ligase [Bacillota bacterium]
MDRCLLVGSGAREHAMAKALTRNGNIQLFAALENSNPGILSCAEAGVSTESDAGQILKFCQEQRIDFCVIGPEKPLQEGLTDALEKAGFPCAAPSRAAAQIETNKIFMRKLLDKYNIPGQIRYCCTAVEAEALSFAEALEWRVAVKPVGLTRGKGVKVWGDHLFTADDVTSYIRQVLESAISGHAEVVIEELLQGQEFTLHFYCDGKSAIPSPLIQDHKRAYDGDKGPNTGGMGSYTCADGLLPFVSRKEYEEAGRIGQQVVEALAKEETPFKGILYGQFMITADGPKIIEFNARFGDPEAMNALALLNTGYVDVCKAMTSGSLNNLELKFRQAATTLLYVVPVGYGTSPKADQVIIIDEAAIAKCEAQIFYASCNFISRQNDVVTIKTTGARTLGVFAEGETTEVARRKALAAIGTLRGDFTYRTDIGSEQSLQAKKAGMELLRKKR